MGRRPGHLQGYAEHRGITHRAAEKQLKKANIDYLQPFSFEEADAKIHAMRHPARDPFRKTKTRQQPTPISGSLHDFAKEQAKKEYYKAEIARLEYEEKIGKLVEVEKVEKEAFRIGRLVRDAVLSVPDRLAGLLAAETDQHKVHTMIMRELSRALEDLPRGI